MILSVKNWKNFIKNIVIWKNTNPCYKKKLDCLKYIVLAAMLILISSASWCQPTVLGSSLGTGTYTTYNYLTAGARTITGTPVSISYVWSGPSTGVWSSSTNWTPTGIPSTGDSVTFSNGVSTTVTAIPAVSVSRFVVSGNTTVNLEMAAANAVTITDGQGGADLSVASGSALNANGTNALALTLAAGATGSISGNMTFSDTAHRFIAADANAITFNNGSLLTQGTGFTGALFGINGTANIAIFTSGSAINLLSGASPFGLDRPSSKVVFQTGSLYKISYNLTNPALAGRTFANYEYDVAGGTGTTTGSTGYIVDNLTVTRGTLNFNTGGNSSIRGNISVASGATFNINPETASIVSLDSGTIQTIINNGTFTVGSNANLTVASSSTVNMGTSIISGAGTFSVASGATLRTGNTSGITSSGGIGSIQTTTRTFNAGANYIYNGTANQVTGNGLPTSLTGALTIANTGGGGSNVVTLSQPMTAAGAVNLTNGVLNINGNTLTLNSGSAAQSIAGASDNAFTISSTLANGIISFAGSGPHTVTLSGFGTTASGGLTIGTNTTLRMDSNAVLNVGGNGSSTSMLTIANILLMNSATNSNIAAGTAPFYTNTSTLEYGVSYGPFQEWLSGPALTSPGVPNNVVINGSGITVAMPNSDRSALGNISITTGTLALNATSGDIKVGGNWIQTAGLFTPNNRTVYFTGSGTNVIDVTGGATLAYLRTTNKTGGAVQLNSNLTVSAGAGGNAMTLNAAAGFNLNGFTLNLNNAAASNILVDGAGMNFTGTGTINFGGGTKTITTSNAGTVIFGTGIALVTNSGGINFGSGISTVNGSLQINAGGFVEDNAPTYGNTSTLIYNTGGTYIRNTEFGALSGAGYPNNVKIQGGTTLNLFANGFADRAIAGNLILGDAVSNSIGSLAMGNTINTLSVAGNVVIGENASGNSNLTLSSAIGGDLKVGGNWTRINNGSFTPNNRAVFFTGSGTNIINSVDGASFNYLLTTDKTGGSVQLGSDLTVNATSGGNGMVLRNTSTFDLNGFTLNLTNGAASNLLVDGAGVTFISATPAIINVSSNPKTITATNSGTAIFGNNVRLIASTGINFGAGLSTINGTLQLNNGGSIVTNPPSYASTSTLIYNSSTTFTRGLEFSAISGAGYPGNVKIQNSTTLNLENQSVNTALAGNLILGDAIGNTPGSLLMDASTANLTVGGNILNGENTNGTSTLTLSTATGGNLTVNGNITVTSGNAIEVPANANPALDGAVLTLGGILTNNSGGTITFRNGTSLLQTGTNTNIGPIRYLRNTRPTATNFTFTYWGSPVANQTLGSIWMSSNSADTFYTWNGAANSWTFLNASTIMQPGKGYIARARIGGTGTDFTGSNTYTANSAWTARFNSTPNNGNIVVNDVVGTVERTDNLLANPYPSAIDLIAFRNDPDNAGKLTGNFYFWTSNTPITNNAYNASDYAIFNVALNAGVGTVSGATPAPDRYVDAGQGFFAEGLSSNNSTSLSVTFKNSHRTAGNNNRFYRTNQNSKMQSALESGKMWLNITNTQGLFKQQLLTYTQGATNGFDPTLDARTFNGNSFIDFYSNAVSNRLTIQSRALPFVDTDIISLGFKTTVAGTYSIAIDRLDGLFASKTLYLQDNLLNVDHNLSHSAYSFNTTVGTFNNRFVLKYISSTLGANNAALDLSQVIVAKIDQSIFIKSNNKQIEKVQIFDLLGRLIFEENKLETNEYEVSDIVQSHQALIIKLILENGLVINRKIIF